MASDARYFLWSVPRAEKGSSIPHQAYNSWPLYGTHLSIIKTNRSLENVRLNDWHVWKVVKVKIHTNMGETLWPGNFNMEVDIKKERKLYD